MDLNSAIANHLKNVETRTGKTLEQLKQAVDASGLAKFGEKRDFLKREFGMGHGDANAVVNFLVGNMDALADPLAEIYAGPKEALRPLHDSIMGHIEALGDFEVAPKKGYISLRRKKQFAMVGPATKTQIEVGLNMKGVFGTDRLIEQAPGGMCQYKVRLSTTEEIDGEFLGWLKTAFESAG